MQVPLHRCVHVSTEAQKDQIWFWVQNSNLRRCCVAVILTVGCNLPHLGKKNPVWRLLASALRFSHVVTSSCQNGDRTELLRRWAAADVRHLSGIAMTTHHRQESERGCFCNCDIYSTKVRVFGCERTHHNTTGKDWSWWQPLCSQQPALKMLPLSDLNSLLRPPEDWVFPILRFLQSRSEGCSAETRSRTHKTVYTRTTRRESQHLSP